MLQLYFSLSSSFLFLALWKNNHCLTSIQKENSRLHSENFLTHLEQILTQNGCSLSDLNEIYFTSSPGGKTGIRISWAFVATSQVLNPQIKLYQINTLLLQAGTTNCISLLTIDSQESKYYGAVYQQKKCLLTIQIFPKSDLEKLTKQFPNFLILKDFQKTDFLTNFQQLKNDFSLVKEIEAEI